MHVALIQAQPVYYDLPASLEKAEHLIREAAGQGVQLVAFGETWLPGYPVWLDYCPNIALWDHDPTKQVYAQLLANSLTVPGPETVRLGQLSHELNIVLVMSVNERVRGTLYNTLLTFDTTGEIVNHHRKLIPTFTERMVWNHGDAAGLQAVSTAYGQIGGLICWEHWMPLARQKLHQSGEQIHVAVWPTVHEMHQVASRHYAFEGRTFVLAVGSILPLSALPDALEKPADMTPETLLQRGGSAIIAPNGNYITEPVYNEETIITAELDFDQIARESFALDVTGHYARPDIFTLDVDQTRREM